MVLLKINNVDFTDRVNQRSYNVQKQDEYETWTDGNWITHHETVRTRVSGSIDLTFLTEAQYTAFNAAIAAVKTAGGYCPVQLWINNTKELATINAFLTIQTKHRWTMPAFGGTPEVAAATVKVIQR